MQKFNCHTHTYRCGHADGNMSDEDYVKAHIEAGFEKMTFTDHAPQKSKIDKRLYMRMDYSQKDEYLESISTLKKKYKGVIEIFSGFEVEYLPGIENDLKELRGISDKIILGQHFVYKDDFSDLKVFRNDIFESEDLIKYANYIKSALELGIVDVVAHPDLFMLSSTDFGEAEKRATEIICASAEKTKTPLEINLGQIPFAIHNPNARINYPSREFWRIASNYDVNVIYGIDAHNRSQIECFERAVKLANKIIGEEAVEKLNFLSDF